MSIQVTEVKYSSLSETLDVTISVQERGMAGIPSNYYLEIPARVFLEAMDEIAKLQRASGRIEE